MSLHQLLTPFRSHFGTGQLLHPLKRGKSNNWPYGQHAHCCCSRISTTRFMNGIAYLVCANRQKPMAQTCTHQFKRSIDEVLFNHYCDISSSVFCSFTGLLLFVLLLNEKKNHRCYAGFMMCIIRS